jgi:peptidyl-tRNA hydrolase
MNELQLEFNIENLSPLELKMQEMQKQIDSIEESAHKVRKKLFAKVGELEKLCAKMQKELDEKKSQDAVVFNYNKTDCLFEISKAG